MKQKDPTDPTPALPLPGEGVESTLCNEPDGGNANPSPWQGGGREGVDGLEARHRNSHKTTNAEKKPYSKQRSIFNSFHQKSRRQALRKNLTTPEHYLWQKLRKRQLGVKFRRQHGIGPYIADFYCHECALVIEIDGDSHFTDNAQEYDAERNSFMRAWNIKTIRFTNQDVMENLEGVLETIEQKTGIRR